MAWQQPQYNYGQPQQQTGYPPTGNPSYPPNASAQQQPPNNYPPSQPYNMNQNQQHPAYPGAVPATTNSATNNFSSGTNSGLYPTAPGGYSPYGQANQQGPPAGIQMDLWNWFQAVDADRTGKINSTELRSALMNGNNTTFSEGTCRLMIRLFDRDNSGQIDVHEFAALWKYILDWRQCFDRFDNDKSGNISGDELTQALSSFGYRLSPQFCQSLIRVYSARKSTGAVVATSPTSINFDDFIEACVTIKNLTEVFAANDRNRQGTVTLGFEQFLDMVFRVAV